MQPGRTPDEVAAALIAELDELKAELPHDDELQRAKNQFARDYVIGRITNEQKAAHLAHAAVIHDDITTADAEFDIFMNITKADVQRVARTYFRDDNRLVLTILRGRRAARAASSAGRAGRSAVRARPVAAAILGAAVAVAISAPVAAQRAGALALPTGRASRRPRRSWNVRRVSGVRDPAPSTTDCGWSTSATTSSPR